MTRLERDLATLATLSPALLRDRWTAIGTDCTPNVPTSLLRKMLAQRLQEKRHGKLPLLVARELVRTAASTAGVVPEQLPSKVTLSPGTRLIREWNGQTIAVEVTDAGFAWKERTYRSLSEIAREVTGVHWSGPRFFGLRSNG